MTDDVTLGDTLAPAAQPARRWVPAGEFPPRPTGPDDTPEPAHEVSTPALSLDELLSEGRRVESLVRICLRSDLYARHETLARELAGLVDPEGNVLSDGDQELADASRAQELQAQLRAVADQMRASTRFVRFQAMSSADWPTFERDHRDADGVIKDTDAYHEQIIARCAIEPRLTVEEVRKMRSNLGQPQFMAMTNTAYLACTTGGVAVPRSPAFVARSSALAG